MGDTSISLRKIPDAKYKFLNEFINSFVYDLLREEKFLSKHVYSYGSFNIKVTGFKTDGKNMLTYSQERKSLSYLYIKHIVS